MCAKSTLAAADNAVINAAYKEKKKLFERVYAIHSFNADRTDEIKHQDNLQEAFATAVGSLKDGDAAKKGYINIVDYITKRQENMIAGLGKDVLALYMEHSNKLQTTAAVYTLKSASDLL